MPLIPDPISVWHHQDVVTNVKKIDWLDDTTWYQATNQFLALPSPQCSEGGSEGVSELRSETLRTPEFTNFTDVIVELLCSLMAGCGEVSESGDGDKDGGGR